MVMKKEKVIITIFQILIIIFLAILSFFVISIFKEMEQILFFYMLILSGIFFLIGLLLLILTIKFKIKKPLRKFLLAIGISSTGFLIGVILHNFYYALHIATSQTLMLGYSMEILHVAFFLFAPIVCPILFLVGAIGTIIVLFKKRKRKRKS